MNKTTCNLISNIKNGQRSRKKSIIQKKSKFCQNILNVLWDEGFISGYRILEKNNNFLEVFLKYYDNTPVISNITNISKPNKSIYYSIKNIWKFDLKVGKLFLSTTNGILSVENCKKAKIGGKALFLIK